MRIRIATRILTVLVLAALLAPEARVAFAEDWSEPVTVMRRRQGMVVEYRAKIESGWLVIQAKHGEGWHTYSMDNPQRASKKTGKEKPDTELPTRFELTGGLEVAGDWHQSKPKDLSMTDIGWFTWGFEEISYFSVPVTKTDGAEASIAIHAQACNINSCSMVEGQTITLSLGDVAEAGETPPIPEPFVKVGDPEVLEKL